MLLVYQVNAMRDLLLASQSKSGDLSALGPLGDQLDALEDAVNQVRKGSGMQAGHCILRCTEQRMQ